jgi:GT2 family glycosyltransferase
MAALTSQRWHGTWQVVVADNGSTDGTAELAHEVGRGLPELQVVDASAKEGAAYARNTGVSHADGRALLFLDVDDLPDHGYLEAMGEALLENDLVCSRIDVDAVNPPWATALRRSPQVDGPGDYLFFLPYAGGNSLGMRRDLFDSLGGFDERLRIAEDVDLCWRAQLAGARLAFVSDAVVHYSFPPTPVAMFEQARSWGDAEARLQHAYRGYGARVPWRETYYRWRRIVRHLPRLRHRAGRAWWLTQLGNSVGRIQGIARGTLRGASILRGPRGDD